MSGKENTINIYLFLGVWQKMFHSETTGRLPERLKADVREPVWDRGRNSAGSYVDYRTASDTIYVRYSVSGTHSMPHMPAIGVK